MSLLSASRLSCIKRDRTLFENLDMQIRSGEIMHLKGKNGAGKTSLLRILAGLATPATGKVHFADAEIWREPEEYAERILFLGHKASLSSTLSPIENIQFWLAQQGLEINNTTIDKSFYEVGLTGFEDVPVGNLSAGQQRRVALSKLWFKPKAKLWLLDEPFTSLDTDGIRVINNVLQHYAQSGGAIVLTSHQPLLFDNNVFEYELEYRF